jgi:hypothetical protein
MDRIKILKQLESARNKYKPEVIKKLIVGEAPPDSIDRFFYFEYQCNACCCCNELQKNDE